MKLVAVNETKAQQSVQALQTPRLTRTSRGDVAASLRPLRPDTHQSLGVLARLQGIYAHIQEDIDAVLKLDPSARSRWSVFVGALGMHAVWAYRIQHWLWNRGAKGLAEFLARRTRRRYGIEIHPAAQIGHRFVIDHGMGIVIGATSVIGDDCLMYQGVTLGMTGKHAGKRHPSLGNNVVVGAHAILLGSITVGNRAKIAAGAVCVHDVPQDVSVAGVPAQIVRNHRREHSTCHFNDANLVLSSSRLESWDSENVRWSCAL